MELVRQLLNADKDGQAFETSISVGAALSLEGEKAEELVRRADGLMYQSKARGKNQATIE